MTHWPVSRKSSQSVFMQTWAAASSRAGSCARIQARWARGKRSVQGQPVTRRTASGVSPCRAGSAAPTPRRSIQLMMGVRGLPAVSASSVLPEAPERAIARTGCGAASASSRIRPAVSRQCRLASHSTRSGVGWS